MGAAAVESYGMREARTIASAARVVPQRRLRSRVPMSTEARSDLHAGVSTSSVHSKLPRYRRDTTELLASGTLSVGTGSGSK